MLLSLGLEPGPPGGAQGPPPLAPSVMLGSQTPGLAVPQPCRAKLTHAKNLLNTSVVQGSPRLQGHRAGGTGPALPTRAEGSLGLRSHISTKPHVFWSAGPEWGEAVREP